MAKHNIESEVTGTVWKVQVDVGEAVSEGDILLILESMKMEIPVESPADGTVAEIRVQPEDPVEEDQVVAVVDS